MVHGAMNGAENHQPHLFRSGPFALYDEGWMQ